MQLPPATRNTGPGARAPAAQPAARARAHTLHPHCFRNPNPSPPPARSLVSTKTEFDRGQVADIIRDLWEATLQSGADVEVQVGVGVNGSKSRGHCF